MAVEAPDPREKARLLDELEQLRTALEASHDEISRLAEDRDRLLGRLTTQSRELLAMSTVASGPGSPAQMVSDAADHEELRVAFEEMQVLTEELEVANNSLQESNRALDLRVDERTRELNVKNAALAETELRFRTLVEGVPQLVWRSYDGGRWTWASPQWSTYTGQSEQEAHGWGWLSTVHPEDRTRLHALWSEAEDSGRFQAEHRIKRGGSETYRWFQTRATPVRDAEGLISEWLGTSTDVDELRRLKDRQQMLLQELQHRVRNTLAVVRSMTVSTGQTSDSVEDFAYHLEGRLNALARTQMVLTRSPGRGVDLEAMVREEMLAQATREAQLDVEGPEVQLSPKAAEVLTLAIHELATNAVKYGALCAKEGRVSVRWEVDDQNDQHWLRLIWQESGVRIAATAPRRKGFGTELIELRVPYELKGSGVLTFRPGGITCEIAFPIRPGESTYQTDAPDLDEALEA